jgi:ABC-type transporter Mla subunit MlaD
MSDAALCNALRYEKWDEAADRIEALTEQLKTVLEREAATTARYDAKLETLTEQLEALTKERDEAMQLLQTLSNMNGDLSRDMYKTKLLLAKAVEGLRAVKQHQDSFFFGPDAQKNERASWRGVMRKVKAALAEIEGEK